MAEQDSQNGTDFWVWLWGGLIAIAILISTFSQLSTWQTDQSDGGYEPPISEVDTVEGVASTDGGGTTSGVREFINNADEYISGFLVNFSVFESAPWYVFLAALITLVSIFIIIYSQLRYQQILKQWDKDIGNDYLQGEVSSDDPREAELPNVTTPPVLREARWSHIEELIKSENESDWRLAIMEADILLEEIVTKFGYQGENLGEKLKTIERSDFQTLDQAWEAHKVRNRIAHEGSDFELTREEFLRVMSLYQRVFTEFHLI